MKKFKDPAFLLYITVMFFFAFLFCMIAQSSFNTFFFCFGIYIFLNIYIFLTWIKKWRRGRLIENIPSSKIRSIAMGLVELEGKAMPWQYLIKGPLSGKDCVFFKYLIEVPSGEDTFSKIAEVGSYDNLFYLNDETGKVLVNPKDAELNLGQPVFIYAFKLFDDIPVNLISFLKQKGIKYQTWIYYKRYFKITEWHIYPDDQIYILGSAKRNMNYLSDFKVKLHEHLRTLKTKPEEMKKFDIDGDGKISDSEWQNGVVSINKSILKDQGTDYVIAKGDEETIFIISKSSEIELLKELHSYNVPTIVIGSLMLLISIIGFIRFFPDKIKGISII